MNRSLLFRIMFGALACAPAFPQAKMLPPEIQIIQSMNFAGLLVSPLGGSITLTSDGALIPDGDGIVPSSQSTCTEARFRLTGPPGATFTLQVEPSTPVLVAAGRSIRLAEFHASLPWARGTELRGTFDATGQAEVKLGGRLDIPAGTPPGLYRAAQVKLQLQVPGRDAANLPFLISALLRAPLFLTSTGTLDFGSIIPGDQIGRFDVLPSGGHQSQTSGPSLFRGLPAPASFQLDGPVGTSYSIQLPKGVQLLGRGQSLRVENFTCSTPMSGVLPPGGLRFGVGAGLVVPPDQVPGVYRSVFTVTVNYL